MGIRLEVCSRRGLAQVGMVVLANNRKQGRRGAHEQLQGSWLLAAHFPAEQVHCSGD